MKVLLLLQILVFSGSQKSCFEDNDHVLVEAVKTDFIPLYVCFITDDKKAYVNIQQFGCCYFKLPEGQIPVNETFIIYLGCRAVGEHIILFTINVKGKVTVSKKIHFHNELQNHR